MRGLVLPKAILRYSIFRSILFCIHGFFAGVLSHYFCRRYDAIVTYDAFISGPLALVIGAVTGAKTIVEINGNYASEENWDPRNAGWIGFLKYRYCQFVVPFVLRHAAAIKLLYPGQGEGFLDAATASEKTYCFHDFVPLTYVQSFSHKLNGSCPPFILLAGMPWYRKGADVLIKAFQAIMQEFPEYQLKLVMWCTQQDREILENLIGRLERIQLLPPMPYESLMGLMAQCEMFVLPSRSEGMGRVLLEAMALQRPIVASRVDGIPTYIKHDETGILVEPANVEDLANALRRMLADEGLRNRLAKAGHQYVFEWLSEEVYVEEYRSLLEKITSP